MVYGAFGNRVSKTVDGVTTQYLVEDDVNPTGYPQVFDELTNGSVTRTCAYGLQRIDENQLTSNVWTPSFYGYDGGGNVRQLTSTAGTVTDCYEYDAFGNSFTVSGSTPNEMLHRGEQYDSNLDLYYLRARYYNPATGRFMSRDPEDGKQIDPKTLHKYLYANGDPLNGIDPRGQSDTLDYVLAGVIVAAVLEAPIHYWWIPEYGCTNMGRSATGVAIILGPWTSGPAALFAGIYAALVGLNCWNP